MKLTKNKVQLEFHLEVLTSKIKFYMQLCEEIHELQAQIFDTSVVLSVDNNHSLDMDGIIAEVKAPYDKIANHSHTKPETVYQIKYEELETTARNTETTFVI